MTLANQNVYRTKPTLKLSDCLMWCLAVWPLFWNLWGAFRITAAYAGSVSVYLLWGITLVYALQRRRAKVTYLYTWFLFIVTVGIELLIHPSFSALYDLSVILCGVLFCVFSTDRRINYPMILRCMVACGLVVSISVILDSTLGIFRNWLIYLYTDELQNTKLTLAATGGIIPHTGSAGGFIYAGLAAYITQIRQKRRQRMRIGNWVIIFIFGVSALLIQKRGFLVDTFLSVLALRLIQFNYKGKKSFNLGHTIKRVCSLAVIVAALFFIYYKVELVREAFDSIVSRFTTGDKTLSGRTDLYALALSLYAGHALTGIGWGRFKSNTLGLFGVAGKTYAVHNVYLQLLCETGIIGLGMFLLCVISTLVYGILKYRKIMHSNQHDKEKNLLQFGLFLQFFFLVYCMSGNPLYDYNFLITYFIGIIFTLVPIYRRRVDL